MLNLSDIFIQGVPVSTGNVLNIDIAKRNIQIRNTAKTEYGIKFKI